MARKFRDGNLIVDTDARRVFLNGEEIHLSLSRYEILELLTRHAGRALPHSYIRSQTGIASYETERWLVASVRRIIKDDPVNPKRIKRIQGFGYRYDRTG